MAKLIFENLTMEQAAELASWFEGAGEQDCCYWFEDRGVASPTADVSAKNWLVIDKQNQTVTMKCK